MTESTIALKDNAKSNKQNNKWHRVLFLPQGNINHPSSRYRLYQYLPLLKDHKIKYKILCQAESRDISRITQRLRIIYYLLWAQVVFIQKQLQSQKMMLMIDLMKKVVIYDIDDAIWLVNPSKKDELLNYDEVQDSNKKMYLDNIKHFDKVIAGNHYLADCVARHNKKVDVIPTVLRTSNEINKKRRTDKIIIGWTGTSNNLYCLKRLKRVFTMIHDKYKGGVLLKVICDLPLEFDSSIQVVNAKWNLDTEHDELSECDIGIMPLMDDEWNRCKCAGKMLIYMAQGIPAVVSPVGVNKDIVDNGKNGFLAGCEQEWFEHLCNLIENERLRYRIGCAGRQTIAENFTPERYITKLVEILRNTRIM